MQTDKSLLLLDEKVSETSKKNNFNAFKINLIKKIQKEFEEVTVQKRQGKEIMKENKSLF